MLIDRYVNTFYLLQSIKWFVYKLLLYFYYFIKFNMNYENISKRLNELKIEDFIWVIYIGIIFLSWFSNSLERKYFLNNDLESKEKYRKIITFIFIVLVIVYSYFLKESVDDLMNLKPDDSDNKKLLVFLSFLASLLIAISGVIFLFISFADEDLDVELAFN